MRNEHGQDEKDDSETDALEADRTQPRDVRPQDGGRLVTGAVRGRLADHRRHPRASVTWSSGPLPAMSRDCEARWPGRKKALQTQGFQSGRSRTRTWDLLLIREAL